MHDHLGLVVGVVGNPAQGARELGQGDVQILVGLDDDLGRAAMEARGRVEVRHHSLGQQPVGIDIHVPVLGAELHRAPGHGFHLADQGLASRSAPQVPRDFHPVAHLEGRIQVHGNAREEIAQGLLQREADDRSGDGAGAQQRLEIHLHDPREDDRRRRAIERDHDEVPGEARRSRLAMAEERIQEHESQDAYAHEGSQGPQNRVPQGLECGMEIADPGQDEGRRDQQQQEDRPGHDPPGLADAFSQVMEHGEEDTPQR